MAAILAFPARPIPPHLARRDRRRWCRVRAGPFAGSSLVEVMLVDPDHVLDLAERGGPAIDEALLADARELRRRVSRMPIPREDGEEPVVACYLLRADRSYEGLVLVPRSHPRRAEIAARAAACTDGFVDLTILRRIGATGPGGTLALLRAFAHHCLGKRMTFAAFLGDPASLEGAATASAAAVRQLAGE